MRAVVAVGCAALLGACGSTTVVLLPEPEARPTAVTMTDSRGEVVLDRPYAAVRRNVLRTQPYASNAEEVKRDSPVVWLRYHTTASAPTDEPLGAAAWAGPPRRVR